tara:strand:+ start:267 stop:455 length:189 start_codon:yes stop_codon:yes gene_type:complete
LWKGGGGEGRGKPKKKKKKESELVQLSFLLVLVNFGRQMMIDGLIAYLKELEKLQHSSKLSL